MMDETPITNNDYPLPVRCSGRDADGKRCKRVLVPGVDDLFSTLDRQFIYCQACYARLSTDNSSTARRATPDSRRRRCRR